MIVGEGVKSYEHDQITSMLSEAVEKKLGEERGDPIRVGPPYPENQEPSYRPEVKEMRVDSPEVVVLKEHISFLREMLKEKQLWYEPVLAEQKAQITSLSAEVIRQMNKVTQLKVALAEAQEALRNLDGVDSGWDDHWRQLLDS